jgi:zinc D-Ala-D-Ala carboxypeptidase
MNISKHITQKEATFSATAQRRGISQIINAPTLENMKRVANECFEPLRENLGRPIRITSFFRSEELNRAIGGSKNSAHTRGEAIDLDAGEENKYCFYWLALNVEFDQLIYEFGNDENPDWIHVSKVATGNRNQILRAIKRAGKTAYVSISKSNLETNFQNFVKNGL